MLKYTPTTVLETLDTFELETDGSMSYYTEGELVMACKMNFLNYPLDTQICHVQFSSSSFLVDQVLYSLTLEYNPSEQRALQYDVSVKLFILLTYISLDLTIHFR